MTLEQLKALVGQRGTQKDVAVAIVDWLAAHAPDDAPELPTVQPKLNKLLKDIDDARRYFRVGRRGDALAHAIGAEPLAVHALLGTPCVIVEPGVPVDVHTALRAQAEASGARIDWIIVPPPAGFAVPFAPRSRGRVITERASYADSIELSIRDRSDEHPHAVVLVGSAALAQRLSKRGRETTFAERVPRGWEFEHDQLRSLAPVPPSRPPATWDADRPLLVSEALTAVVRAYLDMYSPDESGETRWRSQDTIAPHEFWKSRAVVQPSGEAVRSLIGSVRAADDRGEDPSYRYEDAIDLILALADPPVRLAPSESYGGGRRRYLDTTVSLTLEQVQRGPGANHLWLHGGALYAIGPDAARIASLLAPAHTVCLDLPELDAFRDALSIRNPFVDRVFDDLVADATANRGIALDRIADVWRKEVAKRDVDFLGLGYRNSQGDVDGRFTIDLPVHDEGEAGRARAVIARLAALPMAVPRGLATLPLRLRAASQAALSLLPKGEFDDVHVLAHLGAARLLRIRVQQFGSTAAERLVVPTAEKHDRVYTLDGGSTHVVIDEGYDAVLEGVRIVLDPR